MKDGTVHGKSAFQGIAIGKIAEMVKDSKGCPQGAC